MFPPQLLGGIFLGWALGANDAANVFGTAVASRVLSFRTAAAICGLAVIVGAYLQGEAGIQTYRNLIDQDLHTTLVIVCAAALTITYMTIKKLSVSSSQAMVGGIVGIGLINNTIHWDIFSKIIICWVATPLGALLLSFPFYYIIGTGLRVIPMSMLTRDKIIWLALLFFGIYGAYALGANNVANAVGVFSQQFTQYGITDSDLALIGGISIALGAITFGKRVMLAVGNDVMRLNGFTALIAVAASSVTVHLFAYVGVPVSTTQALIGAIVGIGLIRNPRGLNRKFLKNIAIGWVLTPVIALILAAAGLALTWNWRPLP